MSAVSYSHKRPLGTPSLCYSYITYEFMYSFSDSNRTDYITLIANIYTILFTPITKANN